jgi:hypothetical protein
MIKTLHFLIVAMVVMIAMAMSSCINDEISNSASDLLSFSTDTVKFDTVITRQGSPTKQFLVYNRGKKMLNISSIRVAGESKGHFFLNVDGMKGEEFHDIEVRGEDSIFVFVESRLDPTNQDEPEYLKDNIEFVTNGVTQKVAVIAWGQDVIILNDTTLSTPTHLTANKPYLVYGTLTIDTLIDVTIDPGATLLFHDKAAMFIKGKLTAKGSQEKPITLRGDRLDHVVGEIGYDIMSGQWDGVYFNYGSFGNVLSHVTMRGNTRGMQAYSYDMTRRTLHLFNCVLHNASLLTLLGVNAWIDAEGCEFSDAGLVVADFLGGKLSFVNCTFANYYLFSAIEGPILNLETEYEDGSLAPFDGHFDNCIFYGNTSELNIGELDGLNILMRNCLFKSGGEDDSCFINCIWSADPKFYTEREKYIFDYRLRDGSDAIARGDRSYCPDAARYDRYGIDRFAGEGHDIGAYVWVPAPATE